jgi:hypothetical protein
LHTPTVEQARRVEREQQSQVQVDFGVSTYRSKLC